MVVITNQMQEAVDDDAVKFIGKGGSIKGGVFAHGIDRDEKVSAKGIALAIVKGDNVRVIIVLQIFYIDIQYIFIGTKYNGNVAELLALALGDSL